MKKIKIVTLGCDKNLVDSEVIAGALADKYEISPDFESGEAIIINTCGFIGDAKKQSVEAILEAIEEKRNGHFEKIFLTGCLIQRYYNELKNEFPEADGFFKLGDYKGIAEALEAGESGYKNPFCSRLALEYEHVAYIKISDGCDHKCSYCAIPGIRGRYKSREQSSIIEEIETILSGGKVKEIILVGQEITSYGKDVGIRNGINLLLKDISALCGKNRWIRLLYTHPPIVKDDFIETIAAHDNICNYIDFPIQHTETEILKLMRRGGSTEKIISKIGHMRKIIPDIAVRTSIITGFPGETRKIFNSMKKNIENIGFDRLGVFPFSREEDTPAFSMDAQVSAGAAVRRAGEILELQRNISYRKNLELIGRTEKVLIDSYDGEYSAGRTFRDAPDVDNEVLVKEKLKAGEFYEIKITDATDYELYGANFTDITLPS
jgi:ribosomal protein S12 methylthiotransferase